MAEVRMIIVWRMAVALGFIVCAGIFAWKGWPWWALTFAILAAFSSEVSVRSVKDGD